VISGTREGKVPVAPDTTFEKLVAQLGKDTNSWELVVKQGGKILSYLPSDRIQAKIQKGSLLWLQEVAW